MINRPQSHLLISTQSKKPSNLSRRFALHGNSRIKLLLVLNILLITSLACSLPGFFGGSPTPTASPAPLDSEPVEQSTLPATPATPLPPALVESYPPPGAEVALTGPITLYFNQPMDTASVEGALSGQPNLSGHFQWQGDSVVSFTPDAPFSPAADLLINVSSSARSQKGLALLNPLTLTYRTVGFLQVSQVLPEPGAMEVNPASSIVAAFNRPVVPLGAGFTAENANAVPAFTISAESDPNPPGRGEWINTSTYIFYPEPAFAGGTLYTVSLNPELSGVDGSPLELDGESSAGPEGTWSFTTAYPRVVSITPENFSSGVRLDETIVLTFNQPMDASSVMGNFSLLDPLRRFVPGQFAWNEDFTEFTFTANDLLQRFTRYTAVLSASTSARGGTELGESFQANFITSPQMGIVTSEPVQGGIKPVYSGVSLNFSSQLASEDVLAYITFTPSVPDLYSYLMEEKVLMLYGSFAPATDYTLTISTGLEDAWGGRMEEPFTLNFSTAPLEPDLMLTLGSDVLFLTPQDNSLLAQATNINAVEVSIGSVPLEDFIVMLGPNGYDIRQTYQPRDRQTIQRVLNLAPNRSLPVDIPLTQNDQPLSAGLYYVKMDIGRPNFYGGPYLLVSSDVHLTYKSSTSDVFVWAMNMTTQTPVTGAPVMVYDENGSIIAQGNTDADGVFHSLIAPLDSPYLATYAVLGQPGQAEFGMALSNWNYGINPWEFGLPADYNPPNNKLYLYTDRPIYRPGDTVYFRLVSRQIHESGYVLPAATSQTLRLYDEMGLELAVFELPLSAYGTGNGEYKLLPEAQPGTYRLGDDTNAVWFKVAEYRKPEINLQVEFDKDEILANETLTASVNARYFFDAPASNLPLRWAVYAQQDTYLLPGYQVGPIDTNWFNPYSYWFLMGMENSLGFLVAEGEAQTGSDGTLVLNIPVAPGEYISQAGRYRLNLEVTLQDESNLPVSARASVLVNPAAYIVGVKPDSWTSRAGEQAGFEVLAATWDGEPAGAQSLQADFLQVTWVRQEASNPYLPVQYVPQYTQVGSTEFRTSLQGIARVAFTPAEPGVYQLDISGDGAQTQVLLWVGGPGTPIWPDLPNQRMRLTSAQPSYQPGQTASVFIPNDLGTQVQALVTIEREGVLRHEILTLEANGLDYTFPVSSSDIPNIYVSVTLLGRDAEGWLDFRQGYLNLAVEPAEKILNVELIDVGRGLSLADAPSLGPGDQLTLGIRVTDPQGQPVEGEFSLSIVDLAVLALAEPNAAEIVPALYGERPLAVRTALSLAAYSYRRGFGQDGVGGGGGGGDGMLPSVVREKFPDTAYWNAAITTNANGEAQVSVTLPDTITTWRVQARGLTARTQVGQATVDVVATKQLLVRPVTPRFLVVGDHVEFSAVVHNNTQGSLDVEVGLQAAGVRLDDPSRSLQRLTIAAGERARQVWWGTVLDDESANLVFSAVSGALQDAARPAAGAIPILRYSSPQTFATSGTLEDGSDRLELVSLPVSFEATAGQLDVEMSPSLGAAILNGLEAIERFPYESNEGTISRFLPNLETYRALGTFGIELPNLQSRLERNLNQALDRLQARQNEDGGWSWMSKGDSDPYISAYILFGLSRAKQDGIAVPEAVIQNAVNYLYSQLLVPDMTLPSWQLDRLTFQHYALVNAGAGDLAGVDALYMFNDQLSPWAQAFLALSIEALSPTDERVKDLLSNLQTSAIRSATGVHWESNPADVYNLSSPIYTSAVVLYALAQREPASSLLPDALRYLMDHRQAGGCWSSTYDSAWSLMAATQVMIGTGELGGDFGFSAILNGTLIANGQALRGTEVNSVSAAVPISSLYPREPNGLYIRRDAGPGRLYYSASLQVHRPVESVAPLSQGLSLTRAYYPNSRECRAGECEPLQEARVGETITARVTLTVPNDAYYLLVEDYLPAGAEILDTSLKTSQIGFELEPESIPLYDDRMPFENGWGWWYFQDPLIYDDHIAWSASYLPAGTYELTYTLVITHAGEFRLLPARAWEYYFPEVQGSSAGTIFEIKNE
jgi:alpha-2-macroglobulin